MKFLVTAHPLWTATFQVLMDTHVKVLWVILLIFNSMCFRISFPKFWLIFSVLSFTFNYRVLILNEILLYPLPPISGLYFLDLLILISRMTSSILIIIQIRIQKPVSFSLGSVIHFHLNTGSNHPESVLSGFSMIMELFKILSIISELLRTS